MNREDFLLAVKKMREEPLRPLEPQMILISPAKHDRIFDGTDTCPCHGDYRHKDKLK